MSYLRQARYRHAKMKRGVRRVRRRLRGFQSPGLRTAGNMLVTNLDNKQHELNGISVLFAIIIGLAGGLFASSIFGPLGFIAGGLMAFFACTDTLKTHRFMRS